MTNAELIALLREARESVEEATNEGISPDAGRDLVERIDAALSSPQAARTEGAERQDSATKEVEWADLDNFYIAEIGPFMAEVFRGRSNKGWVWAIAQRDDAPTEAEAKEAAIAAARGMR